MAVEADVTKKSDAGRHGRGSPSRSTEAIDILVNNAGIESMPVLLKDIPEAQWDRTLSVNLKGVFLCCQAVIPQMTKQNNGRIINIGSTARSRMSLFRRRRIHGLQMGQCGSRRAPGLGAG